MSSVTAGTALFFGFVAYMIITEVARLRTVTFDTIFGAACGYLLLGAVLGLSLFDHQCGGPSGFHFHQCRRTCPPAPDLIQQSRLVNLFYFSFITLTSTGFGDILPLAPAAKGLAVV